MTFTPGVPIPGEFEKPAATDCYCRRCDEPAVTVQRWESSCGGYTDYKYTCEACGHYWWIEGPDS